MSMLQQAIVEMQMKSYKPTAKELDQEIKDIKTAMEIAQHQGRGPMVAKYKMRLEQLMKKKAQSKEG